MKKIIVFGFMLLLFAAFTSCQYIDIVPDDGSAIEVSDDLSFATDIEPIFSAQSCTNCHPGMSQPNLGAGSAYSSLMDGDYIDSKNPENSLLLTKTEPGASHAANLTAAQVQTIIAWIEQGADDN